MPTSYLGHPEATPAVLSTLEVPLMGLGLLPVHTGGEKGDCFL